LHSARRSINRGTSRIPNSLAVGVRHEEVARSDMRRARASSTQIRSPERIRRRFQFKVNSGEPFKSKRSCNLLAKENWRLSLLDEPKPRGPKVALVADTFLLSCDGKRLAGAASSPNRSVVGPSSEPECVGPSADAGEEVAVGVTAQIVGAYIDDASLVNVTWRDMSGSNEVSEPLGGIGIVLVVVGAHELFGRHGGVAEVTKISPLR
jgi:hypothetical protein